MKTLYHYTSTDTLIKILTSKCIWLSNSQSLNDSKEISWGLEKISSVINSKKINKIKPDQFRKVLKDLRISFYIFSLSSKSDSLSQWRAYANDGSGVSIGFSFPPELSRELKTFEIAPQPTLAEVIYNEKDQEDIISNYINNKNESIDLIQYLLPLIAKFKNPAFSEEHEHRITIVAHSFPIHQHLPENFSPIKFRERDGALISYCEYPLKEPLSNIIKQVVIGPRSKVSELEMRLLLDSHNLSNVEILFSKASYR